MIKTVFFDIGDVLINEDILRFKYYEILWYYLRKHDPGWTFERIIKTREELVDDFEDPAPHWTIARQVLPDWEWKRFKEEIQYFTRRRAPGYIRAIPGVRYVLQNLIRFYTLAIVANQPQTAHRFIKQFGFQQFFKVVVLSEEVHIKKPDPRIFQLALEKTRTEPQHAIMIGDRIDNDIVPAKSLGMKTVLLKLNSREKGIFPQTDRERLYFSSLDAIPNWPQKPRKRTEVPDAVVTQINDLPGIIEQMDGEAHPMEVPIEEKETSLWDIFKEVLEELQEEPREGKGGIETSRRF